MDELLNRLLGYQLPQPNAPAYFEGDTSGIQRQAQQSGLLNAAMALLEAGGPSQQRTNLGQAISRGVGSYQQGVSGSFDQALKDMLASQQIKDAKEKRTREQKMREAIAGSYRMVPTAQGIANTQTNIDPSLLEGMSAEQVVAASPMTRVMDRDKLLSSIAEFAPEKYLELTQPKETATPAEIQGYNLAVRQGFAGSFLDYQKQNRAEPASIAGYNLAVQQGYKGTYKQYEEGMKSAGAMKIMTAGQSGFDNELKVKSAFSAEPVYKAYQEMKTAHNQITDSIKQASPAGDLAAATKFMKLLDPGSVVRESELYMAMQASGALDRAVNYANMRINGQKLTPDQRKDFQSLADKLYQSSIDSFNQKQSEYAGIATAYGLDPNRAVGKPITFSKQIKVDY